MTREYRQVIRVGWMQFKIIQAEESCLFWVIFGAAWQLNGNALGYGLRRQEGQE
jgi:hypothetical protein